MPRSTDPKDFQHTPHPVAVMAKMFRDGSHVAVHTHERHQLIWASRGVMQAQVVGSTWTIPTNRALWVPAHLPHSLDMAGAVEMRSLYVEPGYGRTPSGVKLVSVSKLLAALLSEAATWSLDRDDERANLVTDLILDELVELSDQPIHLPDPTDPRLRLVCDGIRRAPGKRWTLEQWADEVGVSARTLARLFSQETGMRFHDWRHQARLARALMRLATGDTVAMVARDLGYASPSAFAQAFRRSLGVAPTDHVVSRRVVD